MGGYLVTLFDTGTNIVAQTTTDASTGAYALVMIPQADYSLALTPPAGSVETTPTGGSYSFTLDSDKTGLDFGEFQTVFCQRNVYNLLSNNRQQNLGEPGLNGRTVNVVDGLSVLVATATTDASGSYTLVRRSEKLNLACN